MGLRTWLGLKKRGDYRSAALSLFRSMLGEPQVEHGDGFDLVRYATSGPAYKSIQTLANRHKLTKVTVRAENIAALCHWLVAHGLNPHSVLCHGTRNAAEQRMFKAALPDAEVLGTEISETATQFPMTIEWDFHEVKPEWIGRFDVVFSNSWDHSPEPDKLFPVWMSCIAPGGALVLEWCDAHASTDPTPVDPFRAELGALVRIVNRHAAPLGFSPVQIVPMPERSHGERHLIWCR